MFGKLPPEEVDRRRQSSLLALKDMERGEFERWYQARSDEDYWKFGQRCSGCDYWASEQGDLGECQHAGIVSGMDVLRSLDVTFSSHIPPPGYPMRRAWDWCANFKDEFDWSLLPAEYLAEIGAMRDGQLREKPTHKSPQ